MGYQFRTQTGAIQFSAIAFIASVIVLTLIYGIAASEFNWPPAQPIKTALHTLRSLFNPDSDWTLTDTGETQLVTVREEESIAPGLTKIVNVEGDKSLAVRIVNATGEEVYRWHIEWVDIWPQAPDYLMEHELPKQRPGTHIHGAEILSNGDLVFNFEHLSLVSLNRCGKLNWKLPFRTHHSIFVDEDENLWVSAQIDHEKPIDGLPFIKPGFTEPYILKVSPQGEILLKKSVFDLMLENNLPGALYANSKENFNPEVTGDMFHLNDVEVYPHSKTPGFFKGGDVMISLRNINAVFVFDSDWKIKYRMSYEFVRQHDPDFVDGNTITLVDNNNVKEKSAGASSRILRKNVLTEESTVLFEGNETVPYFTDVMGKHQWLPNGNLLLNERYGRVIEVSPQGKLVWEYNNLVKPGVLGLTEEAQRLPQQFDEDYFQNLSLQCSNNVREAEPD